MGKKNSPWDTESGLLDNFDFEVTEAWFGQNEESDDDERIFLFLRGDATDETGEITEDHEERYSTGKNWEVVNDGDEVENATGKHLFHESGGMGRLITALVGLGDDVAEMLQERGLPTVAETFNHMTMHMENRVVSRWSDKENPGEMLEWRLNLPTEVATKAKKKKKASARKAPAKKATSKGAKGGGSKLRAAVIEFAGEFDEDEHEDFVEQVLDEKVFPKADKIEADEELHAEVLDSDSKLWAKAHK